MELEKLSEVELLPVRRRVGDLAHQDVGAQLLHLKASKCYSFGLGIIKLQGVSCARGTGFG